MGYQVFNLGNGNPIKLNDFITIAHEEVERALGHQVPLKIVQKPDQPGDVPRTSANVSLARKLLDYEPSVSLRHGLRKTVEWYVEFEAITLSIYFSTFMFQLRFEECDLTLDFDEN